MADLRESFPTLENGSQEGAALRAVQIGDAVATKNGSIAISHSDSSGNAIMAPVRTEGQAISAAQPSLVAKDGSGNLIYLRTNAAGELLTVSDGGTEQSARGKIGGSATMVDVATITLTADKVYRNLDFVVSCFRDAIFEVVQVDDATETILADALCGPGALTVHGELKNVQFTAGSTGTQELKIRAQNLNALSDFRAALSILELV